MRKNYAGPTLSADPRRSFSDELSPVLESHIRDKRNVTKEKLKVYFYDRDAFGGLI